MPVFFPKMSWFCENVKSRGFDGRFKIENGCFKIENGRFQIINDFKTPVFNEIGDFRPEQKCSFLKMAVFRSKMTVFD